MMFMKPIIIIRIRYPASIAFPIFAKNKVNYIVAKKFKKITGNIVYSTNSDYEYDFDDTNKLKTIPANQQNLKVWLDRKKRKGKVVTLIEGFVGNDDDLKQLAKLLKTKCGTGGSAKDGEIIIQGEVREKVLEILINEGYRAKRAGG